MHWALRRLHDRGLRLCGWQKEQWQYRQLRMPALERRLPDRTTCKQSAGYNGLPIRTYQREVGMVSGEQCKQSEELQVTLLGPTLNR